MKESLKNNIINTILKPAKDEKKVMRINRFLANRYVLNSIIVFTDLAIVGMISYIINLLRQFPTYFRYKTEPYYGIKNIFPNLKLIFENKGVALIYIILLFLLIVLDLVLLYQFKTSFSDKNFNVQQKGAGRWTTVDEIKEQYREIDDKKTEYDGKPGTIISRFGNKLYIDDSPTNNLVIGITRSGKGEMYVYSSIDVYSRSKERPSIIVNDPKIELYKSSKNTLESRGYDVYLLNLTDPLHSMGFNPLTIVIESYKAKDYANAELLAQTFAYSIFNPDDAPGESKFFAQTASQLLCALTIALVEDALSEDERINERRYQEWCRKRKAFDELDESAKKEETAALEFRLSRLEVNDILLDDEIIYLPENITFTYTNDYEKKINMYSVINTFTELARQQHEEDLKTRLDDFFVQRPLLDRAKIKYATVEFAADRTRGSIYSEMISKISVFTYENIAKMTAESSIRLEDIGFGKKPIAIFMSAPDYDKSNHFLASVFIRQTYFALAKTATANKTGSCNRFVKFILDEFGNMPTIEGMANIITVCLGRKISFDMYIQAYEQIQKLYGDDKKTIIGNCGNQIYILSNDNDTTEEFSKLIGNETIIDIQRTGNKLSLSKTFTESTIEKPLINSNELMELLEGECVVKRVIKRKDLNGKPIIPTPIFNNQKEGTNFKYRYTFLTDYFPNPDEIDLFEVNKEDRSYINMKERIWDSSVSFKRYLRAEKTDGQAVTRLTDLNEKKLNALKETMKKLLGTDYQSRYNITDDISIAKLVSIINNIEINPADKRILLILLNEQN